jgi:hypothetical protein
MAPDTFKVKKPASNIQVSFITGHKKKGDSKTERSHKPKNGMGHQHGNQVLLDVWYSEIHTT